MNLKMKIEQKSEQNEDGDISVASNVVNKNNDSNSKRDEGDLAFNLKEDCYTFLALILHKQSDDGSSMFFKLNKVSQIKVLSVVSLAWFLQMFSFLYLAASPGVDEYTSSLDEDDIFLYNCKGLKNEFDIEDYLNGNFGEGIPAISELYLNNTNSDLTNQYCSLYENRWIGLQSVSGDLYLAKIIAVFLTLCFIIGDYLSIPRVGAVILLSNSLITRCVWVSLCLTQLTGLIVSFVKVFSLIYASEDVIDALTVGISFIILLEIDNKLYELLTDEIKMICSDHNRNNNVDLYQIKIKKEEIKYTVYQYISPTTFDLVLFCNTIFISFWCTIYYNTLFFKIVSNGIANAFFVIFFIVSIGAPAFVVAYVTFRGLRDRYI